MASDKVKVDVEGIDLVDFGCCTILFWWIGWLFLHDLVDYAIKHWPR